MPIAEIALNINHDEVRKYINEKIDSSLRTSFFTWDLDQMAKLTCMSKSFLENEILRDPRMKILERRKEKGKRYWFYEESLAAMREIMDEW
ncbi:hypothetical protein V7127_02430 [Bacillus sp. JJ1773]|uniref:hypothetical protein n=1 Tax=Bacillus sp. JJ1773 TaxID=3122965 RepID=UPI002FFE4A95